MRYKPFQIIDLYKHVQPSGKLFPEDTSLEFWDGIYADNSAVIDREFARRFAHFLYMDFMEEAAIADSLEDFKKDVLSVLSCNQKRYAEMYRVFLVSDEDDPITYNYDMTETTGAQHSEIEYGGTSATRGSETFTKGQQQNTEGAVTNTHHISPFDNNNLMNDSSDERTAQTFTDGERIDTNSQRTDTTTAHTDKTDSDEWTLTRKGNIGTQTAADILSKHSIYWTETYKFLQLIFDDICKALLLVGD